METRSMKRSFVIGISVCHCLQEHKKTTMALIVMVALSEICLSAGGPPDRLKLGLITPLSGSVGFERVAAASTMALEQARLDGYLTNVNVSIIWENDDCDGKESLGRVVDLWDKEDIDGFFGLPCSVASINAGKIIAYWDLPLLSYSSVDPVLADKNIYNTLVRLMSPYNRMAEAMVELFNYYQWHRVVLVMMPDPDMYCDIAGRAFEERFKKMNITVADWMRTSDHMTKDKIDAWLEKIRRTGRIVVICGMDHDLLQFMLHAHEMGMTDGDYVYITPSLWSAENLERRWIIKGVNNEESQKARAAYGSLLQMAMGFMRDPDSIAFMEQVPHKMAESPWNYSRSLERGLMGSPFALFLYDSVYLYAMVADELVKKGISPRIGSQVYALAKQKTFQGKSGIVTLDENGDRIANYRLWHLPPDSDIYEGLMEIVMTETDDRVRINHQRDWGLHGLTPPPDSPACGYFDELCPGDNKVRDVTIISVVVLGLLVVSAASTIIIMCNGTRRRKNFEHELELMLWKIRFDDLEFFKPKSNCQIKVPAITTSIGSEFGGTALEEGDLVEGGTHLAYFKGTVVAVRLLLKRGLLLTRKDHLELKLMREISHDNLNSFVGACVHPPHICTIYKYCTKGTLQTILLNEDIKLDLNFKYSLIMDLIQGMECLHRSELKSHGNLRTKTCVVDGCWVLKITNWGPSAFSEQNYTNDEDRYSDQLNTAPELLREVEMAPRGSPVGDVYSFAIMLQEILYRSKAFAAGGSVIMVNKDLVGRVRNGETPPFRPELPFDEKLVDPRMQDLMRECWREDPTNRPEFSAIKTRFDRINKGRRYNILDNGLRMMEKYANNLEDLVAERTRLLEEEKKKTDRLLYRMLPTSIANNLKQGRNTQPEMFSDVSVYFSDVVSFATIASQSTPMEVVDFLNDLWMMFDDILSKYDVYKIESIGDTYMVASGLPVKTKAHAAEIANMSLEILSSVLSFKIRHQPLNQLKIRIGIHSGPVVAGVVGLTMPRYCLFGDTVNTASRMKTAGEALRIHISQQTRDALISLQKGYMINKRGQIELKGIGVQTTHWLEGRDNYNSLLPMHAGDTSAD